MKLLLVMASDESYSTAAAFLRPLGFELLRYRQVQKAMDNIDEMDPAGIIISARDFPRHWKTMVQFVRYDRNKSECPIILLKGTGFPAEETQKALFMEVNGIVPESLQDPAEAEAVQDILSRYVMVDDKRKSRRFRTDSGARFGFMFTGPGKKIITGTVKTVSSAGISFEPDHPHLTRDMGDGTVIPGCSFRAGGTILSPSCVLRRNGDTAALEFQSFPGGEQEQLETYLESLSEH